MTNPVETLRAVARSLSYQGFYAAAAEVFEAGLQLRPRDPELLQGLTEARQNLGDEPDGEALKRQAELLEKVRRDAIDAEQLTGLASSYLRRDQLDQASECLELARGKREVDSQTHKLRARLLIRRKRFAAAAKALRSARRYDPFDAESAIMASQAEYEIRHYHRALSAAIDAFLLLDHGGRERSPELRQRISELRQVLGFTRAQMSAAFQQQRETLETLFQRLDRRRLAPRVSPDARSQKTIARPASRLELARRLRQITLFSTLSDDQIFALSAVAAAELHPADSQIFAYRSQGTDIYLLESGSVAVLRPTGYGRFELGRLGDSDVLGEVNFITRSERSGDAVALSATHLLRLDSSSLRQLIDGHPKLGLNVYLSFWRNLARKLRQTNEQLRTFFSSEEQGNGLLRLGRALEQPAAVEVTDSAKVELFLEQGLSGEELTVLAEFSEVKRFASGVHLFHEGEPGSEMYVVLEGQVAISKYIPGGGEEALAVLRRGDFFGEMSLIDGEPRSADAHAVDGPATVISFDQNSLNQVMAMEPTAALSFLRLLCNLICHRLREIDEKVTAWRIMTGGRSVADRSAEQLGLGQEPTSTEQPVDGFSGTEQTGSSPAQEPAPRLRLA